MNNFKMAVIAQRSKTERMASEILSQELERSESFSFSAATENSDVSNVLGDLNANVKLNDENHCNTSYLICNTMNETIRFAYDD